MPIHIIIALTSRASESSDPMATFITISDIFTLLEKEPCALVSLHSIRDAIQAYLVSIFGWSKATALRCKRCDRDDGLSRYLQGIDLMLLHLGAKTGETI